MGILALTKPKLYSRPANEPRWSFARSFFLLAAVSVLGLLARVPPPKPNSAPGERKLDQARPAAPFDAPQSPQKPRAVNVAGTQERGHGGAATPAAIPWQGWKNILRRTINDASEHRLLAIAAGVVFYGLLALFPAITALVSSYGLFTSPATISDHLSFLASIMPADAYSIVRDQIARIVAKGDVRLSFSFAASLAFALWSANAGMKAMIDALNVVYEENEKRGFIRLNLVSLAYTIAAVVAMLVAVGAVVITPLLLAHAGLGSMGQTIVKIARWPAVMLGMLLGLSALYRYGPSRREVKWRWTSVGAVCATVSWFAGSALLSFYFANFADYDATYGSLGAAIGTMMWMWMSAVVILLGAELNSEIERQAAQESATGIEQPLGRRGSMTASRAGAAQAP